MVSPWDTTTVNSTKGVIRWAVWPGLKQTPSASAKAT